MLSANWESQLFNELMINIIIVSPLQSEAKTKYN